MKTIVKVVGLVLLAALGVFIVTAQDSTDMPIVNGGDVITLKGQVLDVHGDPVEGAVVEIWQTDQNGNYDHPNDAAESELDPTFQYFGTATSDAEGNYEFITIKPLAYGNRPSHVHVKVKLDGEEVLTTQFYFIQDRDTVEGEAIFNQAGAAGESLLLAFTEDVDANENPIIVATGDIVLDLDNSGSSGSLQPTPAQAEGPYYPVVDFSDYDTNLTMIGDQSMIVVFTLLNLNTASSDDFLTIPEMSNRMVREFNEYRPYISIAQFRREIGKYVDATQVAAYEAYVYVPVSVDAADAETLKQIPGVDDALAESLIAGRPYGSNAAFLEALAAHLSAEQVALAEHYLVTEQ